MDVSEQIFPKAFIDRVQYIINILNQIFFFRNIRNTFFKISKHPFI